MPVVQAEKKRGAGPEKVEEGEPGDNHFLRVVLILRGYLDASPGGDLSSWGILVGNFGVGIPKPKGIAELRAVRSQRGDGGRAGHKAPCTCRLVVRRQLRAWVGVCDGTARLHSPSPP